MKITVIQYRKYSDIDIQFEDGIIVKNIRYSSFKNGEVAYPQSLRTVEVTIARNGMELKIISYRSASNVIKISRYNHHPISNF